MENKNVILSDDELKDVTGGAGVCFSKSNCNMFNTKDACLQDVACAWVNDACVAVENAAIGRSL